MDDTNQEVSKIKVTKEPTLISLEATLREGLVKASRAIHSADAIFFTSGAGLGVGTDAYYLTRKTLLTLSLSCTRQWTS